MTSITFAFLGLVVATLGLLVEQYFNFKSQKIMREWQIKQDKAILNISNHLTKDNTELMKENLRLKKLLDESLKKQWDRDQAEKTPKREL